MLILLQPQSLIIAISITKKSKLHSLSSSSAIWLASKIFYSSSSRKKSKLHPEHGKGLRRQHVQSVRWITLLQGKGSFCPRLPLADGGTTVLISFPVRGQGQEDSSSGDWDPSTGPSVLMFSQQRLCRRNSSLEGW